MDRKSIEKVKSLLAFAFEIYIAHYKILVSSVAVILVPIALLTVSVDACTQNAAAQAVTQAISGLLTHILVLLPLSLVGGILAQGVVFIQLNAILSEQKIPNYKQAWCLVMRRFEPLLGTSVLVAIGTALGMMLFIVPGLWFLYRCQLVAPVVTLENCSGLVAIRRSSALVSTAKHESLLLLGTLLVVTFAAELLASWLLPASFVSLGTELLRIALLPLPLLGIGLFYHRALNIPLPS